MPNSYKKYDKIAYGLLAGLVVPFVGYAVILMIFEQINGLILNNSTGTVNEVFNEKFRVRTSAILAITLNIILLQFAKKRWLNEALRGIVIATFILIAIWLGLFWTQFFGNDVQ